MIVVAFGWRMVPEVYSVAMVVIAVIFWFYLPDPAQQKRAASSDHISLADQLAPMEGTAGLALWYATFSCSAVLSPWRSGCPNTMLGNMA